MENWNRNYQIKLMLVIWGINHKNLDAAALAKHSLENRHDFDFENARDITFETDYKNKFKRPPIKRDICQSY